MARQVLIIHGWSDTSHSFHSLATFLAGHGYAPKLLWLGDYISRDDDVRVEDVGRRMGEVIAAMSKSGELDKSFDVIVHSTGGLVAREWLTFDFRETDMNKLVTVWDSRLEADVPLAVLPTRTHGSIIDPDRADRDKQERIQETPAEKLQLGQLILQALKTSTISSARKSAPRSVCRSTWKATRLNAGSGATPRTSYRSSFRACRMRMYSG